MDQAEGGAASRVKAARGGTVLTVGTFDGVHRGHWAVLVEIARRASESARRSLLVTFEPHPLAVVNPEAAPRVLTTPLEKREILAQSGVDIAVFLPFTQALAQLEPEGFVDVLRGRFGMEELVIGHDHGFGRGRRGDVELLRRLGARDGFGVDVVEEIGVSGRPVSSTAIRRAVAGGDLAQAEAWLGRRYAAVGTVARGAGRGRRLGVPTINVTVDDQRKLLPPDGVYAVWVEWSGGRRPGMLNQGPRPTFGDQRRGLEIHLFEFDGDLYGALVKVEWVERLRDTRPFATADALARQLAEDAERARRALTGTAVSR